MAGPSSRSASDLHVHLDGRNDLARQIYRQMRAAIVSGRISAGERVPPTRELAERLDVSRNTVSLAYEWLTAEGLLSGQRGEGSFVAGQSLVRRTQAKRFVPIRYREAWDAIALPAPRITNPRFDFGVGMPDAALFPYDVWRRLLTRSVRSSLSGGYNDPRGHPRLRESIARHVGVSRGVNARADEIVVTNGAQGAFDLIARTLLEPGVRVVVEEPGYPPPRLLFESYGARVTPVRVDDDGLDVSALPDDARLVYVTPSHQFPLGMPMSHARRLALLDWAERRNAVIIEDDYDSEFRFGGRPLETLQAIDRSGRVLYVGSFSKSLLPALRLGFLAATPSLQSAIEAAAYVAGWFCQWPAQEALARLIDEGLLARHVRRMRRQYARRHEEILRRLTDDFDGLVTPVPSATGMHLTATLHSKSVRFEREVAAEAGRAGVAFDRLSAYCATDSPQPGLVLGYGSIATASIGEGLKRLRKCFERQGR
jgi:GntR family transcriptional regulator/MocR family aminotransferase